MKDHDVTSYALAKEIGKHPSAILHLRKQPKLPKLNSDQIDALTAALTKLTGTKVKFVDLFEEIEDAATVV